jgi:hypothetical protein
MAAPRGPVTLATSLGVLAFLAGCSLDSSGGATRRAAAREKGAREAAEAVASGTLRLKEYPPPPASAVHGEYVKLLQEKCGVGYESRGLPPGVAEADYVEEVRGWNDVMAAEINRKFGAGILGKLHEEAQKRWEERVKGSKG